MGKNPIQILLLESIHPIAESLLKSNGFKVHTLNKALGEDDLIKEALSFDAIGIRSKTKITEKVISSLPQLKAIGCYCIGTNQVALDSANKKGVPVFNAPYSNTRSVAELVIAECIALSRQLGDRSNKAHLGEWVKSASGSKEVRGKTIGIVGYGHIGTQVSVLAESLGLNVIYFDVVKKLPLGNATPMNTLDELLCSADFVTLHVPETPETKKMITSKELKKMKKGVFFINASRGSVVEIDDLASLIKEGHIGGAAIDVFPKEPKSNSDPFSSPLQGLENVILTPHIGGSTEEAQEAIGGEVSESLTQFLNLGSTYGSVNFPSLDLKSSKESYRILNVHKNVPGVLRDINTVVSKAGLNIKAQQLGTDNDIGYLAIDVQAGDAQSLADEIDALETSIKTRVVSFPPNI